MELKYDAFYELYNLLQINLGQNKLKRIETWFFRVAKLDTFLIENNLINLIEDDDLQFIENNISLVSFVGNRLC